MYQFSTRSWDTASVASVYAEQLEQIELAESMGFDDVWLSEHHFTESNYLPSPLVMAGAVAMRTQRINIGIGVAAAPFYHPIRLAEDCAVVDNLSDGRLMLGAGIGYRDDEYDRFGFPRKERASYTEESIEVIRKCWSADSFSHSSRHFEFTDVNCTPKPIQDRIPIWVTGGAKSAIRRAARLGDGWFPITLDSSQLATYRDELETAGRTSVEAPTAAMPFAWIYATDDPERAWSILGEHAIREVNLFAGWSVPGLNLQTVADIEALHLVNIGTPEQIVEWITTMYERTPIQRLVMIPNLRGAPIEIANRSLELLAEQVLPKLRALGDLSERRPAMSDQPA